MSDNFHKSFHFGPGSHAHPYFFFIVSGKVAHQNIVFFHGFPEIPRVSFGFEIQKVGMGFYCLQTEFFKCVCREINTGPVFGPGLLNKTCNVVSASHFLRLYFSMTLLFSTKGKENNAGKKGKTSEV